MARDYKMSAATGSAKTTSPEKLHPTTRLERLLWEARQEFLRSGETPLDWDGLAQEIAGRRGGAREED
jgi:hypothetical protein